MKKILLTIFILSLCSIQLSLASVSYHYDTDGTGTFTVKNDKPLYYFPDGHYVNLYWTFYVPHQPSSHDPECMWFYIEYYSAGFWGWTYYHGHNAGDCGKKCVHVKWENTDKPTKASIGYAPANYYITLTVSNISLSEYYIYGDVSCVNSIQLYQKDNENNYFLVNDANSSTSYNFSILDQQEYKLVFDGSHEYEFMCNGNDVEYDYSACTYIYGYTCNINWVKLWRNDAGSWTYVDMESQPNHGLNTYVLQIEPGYDYKVNFSDGHEHTFTCSGSDIEYDWDRCVWAYPPSPWQPPEIIPWYLGYDNNIVFMRDSHGNFIENAQIAVYNKNTGNYTQKWTNTPDPYILLAANNDSNDDVIVMCRTFDGVFTLETVDPAFGTDENVTWTNWTIPIMYNLEIHPIDQSNMPLHHVFVSMYEYTPFDPLAFFGYDTYWGCIPVTNCSGFSRCDIVAEKEGYRDYNVTGLNWTTKSALIKDYKQDIILARES